MALMARLTPDQDQDYLAYCQGVLDFKERLYRSDLHKWDSTKKLFRFFLTLAVVLSAALTTWTVFSLVSGSHDPLILILVLSWAVVGGTTAVLYDRLDNAKKSIRQYENCATCAERIVFYALPHEEWLAFQQLEQQRQRVVAESQAVCTALRAQVA